MAANRVFALAMMLGGLGIGYIQARVLSTQLTSAGVSQLTWRGRMHLRWDEITTVTRKSRSITLADKRGSVIVPVESFYDTAAAIQFMDSHLPPELRKN